MDKRRTRHITVTAQLFAGMALLASGVYPAMAATLTTEPFGTTGDGKAVSLTTMSSANGLTVKFISYGGIITQILAPDRNGHPADIVLGFASLHDYETNSALGGLYFGALIGRYANRIAKGRFSLDGKDYTLAVNNPPNALHGGTKGFDKRVWDVTPVSTSGPSVSATLRYVSPDGEEGYPGTLKVAVTYKLDDDNTLSIHYQATTDKDTVVNLTNHSYFNLAGAGSPDGVAPQMLMINADTYTPIDHTSIPVGKNEPVHGTPFDFRKSTAIGARMRTDNQQLLWAQGYDHNWVLNKSGDARQPQLAAEAYDPVSGRTLQCLTTEPAVQFYTSNFLKGTYAGIGGIYRQTDAFTLETQHFPDSPNHPDFPTTELKPGQTFDSTTIFKFGVRR
jgi:aldose 1-epimerase